MPQSNVDGSAAVVDHAAPAAREPDGPYVICGADGWAALTLHVDGTVERSLCRIGDPIYIPSTAGQPAFSVPLREPEMDRQPCSEADREQALFVLGDSHGEYGIIVPLLREHAIVDASLRWSFGTGQAIILGDVFDRGPHQLALLWLFYKLEAEAREAGGRLQLLLGNHDVMAMRGDLRYLHARHSDTAVRLGVPDFPALFGGDTLLGRWLRTWPALVRIGPMLFVHGGISPELCELAKDIEDVNASVCHALGMPHDPLVKRPHDALLATHRSGPLWYRGYFHRGRKRPSKQDVVAALAHFGGRRVFVGHTPAKRIVKLFGGRVVAAHVYPERDKDGRPILEALIRRDGKWFRINAQGLTMPFRLTRLQG